jgi:hypothetical protein
MSLLRLCALAAVAALAGSVAIMGIDCGSEFMKVRFAASRLLFLLLLLLLLLYCVAPSPNARRHAALHRAPLPFPPRTCCTLLFKITLQVSVVKPGMPFQVVANFQSKRKTPTMLAFASGERLFGADAEALLGRKPTLVLASPLALLGRNASHPLVRAALYESFQAADVRPAATRGGLEAHFPALPAAAAAAGFGANATELVFPVEELAAMLLAHARDFASHVADQRIQDAVITVPAYAAQGACALSPTALPARPPATRARRLTAPVPRPSRSPRPPRRRALGAHRRGGARGPQGALAHRRKHGHGRALRHRPRV